jgi:uncharacterized cofD-like protein
MSSGLNNAIVDRFEPAARPDAMRVVALGGGTGLPNVLRGLRPLVFAGDPFRGASIPRERLTAIVTTSDDGGSSGRLRRDFNIIPPGDIRNCLAALAEDQALLAELFQFRFENGDGLSGHALGNLVLTALNEVTGDATRAIEIAARLVGARGIVLPATRGQVSLSAELEDGRTVSGETAIVSSGAAIRRLSLVPQRPACVSAAADAIRRADVVVVGPGSLYTSILPPLLVPELGDALRETRGVRVFVLNLMTEPGETIGFDGPRHLEVIREHVGDQLFDGVLFNTGPIPEALVADYGRRGSSPIAMTPATITAIREMGASSFGAPLACEGPAGRIRHHPGHLAVAITACARLTASRAKEPAREDGQDA